MRSLGSRVALSAAVVLAVFVVLSAYVLDRAFRESARSAREERLLAQVYLLMAAAEVDAQGRLTLPTGPTEPRLELPGSGLYAAILDCAGNAVWRSRSSRRRIPSRAALPGRTRFEQSAAAKAVPPAARWRLTTAAVPSPSASPGTWRR
jgi:two-component system sensor histidine kinase PhoQ